MDEEYDVFVSFSPSHFLVLIAIALGDCPRDWPDGVYPLGLVIRPWKEGPPHGQE